MLLAAADADADATSKLSRSKTPKAATAVVLRISLLNENARGISGGNRHSAFSFT